MHILSMQELQNLSKIFDFSSLAVNHITTSDIKPIDTLNNHLLDLWKEKGSQYPTLNYQGELHHPAPPEHLRIYLSPSKREAWTEKTKMLIQGIHTTEHLIVICAYIHKTDKIKYHQLCGVDTSKNPYRFIFHRSLPENHIENITQNFESLFAHYEADLIQQQSSLTHQSHVTPRL